MLDATASDIQPVSTSGSPIAGSVGMAADAGHQHTLVSHNHTTANTGGNIPEAAVTNLTLDLAAKAPLASPALTGSPTAPTASALNNSTKVATTAYADSAVSVEKSRAQTAEGLLVAKANNLSDVNDAGSSRFNIAVSQTALAAAVAVANVSATFSAGSATGAPTSIDGYSLQTNDLVLLTNQTTASQNGLWQVSASTNWSRPTEFAYGAVTRGRSVKVMAGTYFAATDWILNTTSGGVTIDTTSQTWTQVGSRGVLLNLTLTAGTTVALPYASGLGSIVAVTGLYGTVMPGQRPIKVTFSGALQSVGVARTVYFGLGYGAITTPGNAACYNLQYISQALAIAGIVYVNLVASIPTSSFTPGTSLTLGATGSANGGSGSNVVTVGVGGTVIANYLTVEEM